MSEQSSPTEPRVPKERQRNTRYRKNQQTQDSASDTKVESEFQAFVANLRKMNLGGDIVYQINNYKEGIECTFRFGKEDNSSFTQSFSNTKKKPLKQQSELTPEQLEKIEAKREKKRAARAKRIAERKAQRAAEGELSDNVDTISATAIVNNNSAPVAKSTADVNGKPKETVAVTNNADSPATNSTASPGKAVDGAGAAAAKKAVVNGDSKPVTAAV